jgi:hypothetical protein
MRVRDIVRRSFDHLVSVGTLPTYERQPRYVPPPARHNAPWRPDQLELLHYADTQGALYDDPTAWRAAVGFIRSFTSAAAGSARLEWHAAAFCGPFSNIPAAELLRHVSAAMLEFGLHSTSTNTTRRSASFEASDNPTVSALPEPYGKWLQIREERPRWKEPVALQLIVRVCCRVVPHVDGRIDGYVDLQMSAPAIALLQSLAGALDRPAPRLSGCDWLHATSRLTASTSHTPPEGSTHA